MKRIFLIRHGEAIVNLNATFLEDEGGLTETGKMQAKSMAERVSKLPIDAILCSPMQRTKETVAEIERLVSVPVEFSELLVERRIPPLFWGKEKSDPNIHSDFQLWLSSFYNPHIRFDGALDDYARITARAREALSYLHAKTEDTILVVTHGYFLRVMLACVLFSDTLTPDILRAFVRATSTQHTGITELRYVVAGPDDVDPGVPRWKVRVFNDHAHLG